MTKEHSKTCDPAVGSTRLVLPRRGRWRVQWEGRNGCIRQEWFKTKKLAFTREDELWRGRIDASTFYEGA